jgi:hypothetical protein
VQRRICDVRSYPDHLPAVAAYGLPAVVGRWPDRPVPPGEWPSFLAAVERHRVTGQLERAVADGAFPVTAQQREDMLRSRRTFVLRGMLVDAELVRITAALRAAEVPVRVLKGSAVARLDYADPRLRTYNDVDLLVRPADFPAAVRILQRDGMTRILAEPRPGFDARFDKGTTLRTAAGLEVDLHRTFVLGPWGFRVDLDELWACAETFTIGGTGLDALSPRHRFLHACYHAALGDWPLRLGSLRDVAEQLPGVESDRGSMRATARRWGVESVVAAAVADTVRLLGLPGDTPLRRWAAAHRPGRRDLRWLALHTREDKTFAAQALATVGVLSGVRARVSYVRALALPDAEYVADRHATAGSRLRYGLAQAWRGRA